MAAIKPPIKWAQRRDIVYLSVAVEDISNETYQFTDDKSLCFECEGGTKPRQKYAFELQLFGEINQENCKVKKAGRELLIVLSKKDNKAPYWPRLTEGKQKAHNVQVDFNRWRDEEDSSGDEFYKDDEFESMMNTLGKDDTGGNAADNEASDDSDDEQMPDLEPAK